MNSISEKIRNSQLLRRIFGYWPSFHDAEVISFELYRDAAGVSEPSIRSKIYLFEFTPEVDSRGFYVLQNQVVASFRFVGVDEVSLDGFNQQNVLQGLRLLDVSARQLESLKFEVHFDSSFGLEARFKCRDVEVESVEAAGPRDDALLPRRSAPKAGAYKR